MHDSQVIGLRHPQTREVLLCSILGRMRTVFALVVYRNPTGHRWILKTILDENGSPEDTAFDQDAIKIDFSLKRELSKEDKATLAALNFKPSVKGGHVWPSCRSHFPGAYPWAVTEQEAETLIFALPRVAAAARLASQFPDLWKDHLMGEIAFVPDQFDPATEELSPEALNWHPMVPPPAPVPESVVLDSELIARFAQLAQPIGFLLELDVAYSPAVVVTAPDRPRLPKIAMAADRASGYIGGVQLSEDGDLDGAHALGSVLSKALVEFKARPVSFRVRRTSVAAMLADVARQLDIPIVQDLGLPAINEAMESLEFQFRRR